MSNEKKEITKREAQTPTEVERTKNRKVYITDVDIYERGDDTTILLADMPGVDEKSVNINLEKNVLTITGCVKPEISNSYKLVYAEYDTGDYQRAFTLSNEIDIDKIGATMKNGVLRLVLPKAEAAKPRKIEVTVG
jgi:HSP20 family molecular chaperone IbpA